MEAWDFLIPEVGGVFRTLPKKSSHYGAIFFICSGSSSLVLLKAVGSVGGKFFYPRL